MNQFQVFLPFLLVLATAHAQDAYRFKIGSAQATIVSDGRLVFQTMPYNVPTQAVERAYRQNFREINPYLLEQNILIVDLPAGRVMIDTGSFNVPGVPTFARAGKLIENLRAAGISPSSIDAIVLSHAHIDHVAGLTKRDGSGAFRNAMVYINRRDHEFWSADELNREGTLIPEDFGNLIKNVYLNRIAWYQARDKFRLVEDNDSPIEGIRFIPSNGHSVGHSTIEITSDGKRLLAIGDSWVTKSDQVQNPEWGFFIETNQTEAYLSRVDIMEKAERSQDLILSYHEEFPGLGRIRQVGPFFEWVTAGIQSDGDDAFSE